MMKKRLGLLTTLLLLMTWFSSVSAHDLWLVPEPRHPGVGEEVRLLIQTGMKFPESLSAVTPDRLEAVWIKESSDRRDIPGANVQGNSLVLETRFNHPGVALAAVAIRERFIHLKAEEFNEYLEHDGLPQILLLRKNKGELMTDGREMYAKFAKAILKVGEGGPQDLATKPAGLRIEIVPLEDPHQIDAEGGSLPVQVLFEDQPLEGVYVYTLAEGQDKYKDGYVTDSEGKTTVPIRGRGLWSLHCIYMRPYSDKSQADWESFFATTTFLLGET